MTALRELAERWKAEYAESEDAPMDSRLIAKRHAAELLSILDAEGDGGAVGEVFGPKAVSTMVALDKPLPPGTKLYTHPARSGVAVEDNVQCAHCGAIFTRRDWTADNFDRPIPRCQCCGSSGAPQPVRTTDTHHAQSGVVSDEDACAAVDAYNSEMGGIDCDLPKDIRDADHECMRAALEHYERTRK